jgi:hypothetical protein
MTTTRLHEPIRLVHPDLCDDRVGRVIGRRHFGKRWKHAVRSAQQGLRRRGVIARRGDTRSLNADFR